MALDLEYVHLVYMCTDATPGRWKDTARAGDMYEWVVNIHAPYEESGASLSIITTFFLEQHRNMANEFFETGILPEGLTELWVRGDEDLPWECKYCSHFDICVNSTIENPLTEADVIGIKEHYESVI